MRRKLNVWRNKEGLTSLVEELSTNENIAADVINADDTIIHTFYAESHFDAMTQYYEFMNWGKYETTLEEDNLPFGDLELLFSYGTLQLESVQLSSFGRLLEGEKTKLYGYRVEQVRITDSAVLKASGEEYHPIVFESENESDCVVGTVFEITVDELKAADRYEVDDYKRVSVKLSNGKSAWMYVGK